MERLEKFKGMELSFRECKSVFGGGATGCVYSEDTSKGTVADEKTHYYNESGYLYKTTEKLVKKEN